MTTMRSVEPLTGIDAIAARILPFLNGTEPRPGERGIDRHGGLYVRTPEGAWKLVRPPEPELEAGALMTEPDPVAALAAQLEELRRQLAAYTGETGHLRARMEQDAGQVLMLLLEVKQLREQVAEANARRQAAEPPAPFWVGLAEAERAGRLTEVRAWVERVACVQWPGYMARLAPCWANHPEAVWELSNLMTEWVRVYGDPENRPLQDALWFFERWLPGVLSRLTAAVRCDVAGCQLAPRHPSQRSPPPAART